MSETGRLYGQVCKEWGVDPAAPLVPIDDVLAHNLRVALSMSLRPEQEPEPEMDEIAASHRTLEEQARAAAARWREEQARTAPLIPRDA